VVSLFGRHQEELVIPFSLETYLNPKFHPVSQVFYNQEGVFSFDRSTHFDGRGGEVRLGEKRFGFFNESFSPIWTASTAKARTSA